MSINILIHFFKLYKNQLVENVLLSFQAWRSEKLFYQHVT